MLDKLKDILAKVALRGVAGQDALRQAELEEEFGLEPGSLFQTSRDYRPPALSFAEAIRLAGEEDARTYLTSKELRRYRKLLRKWGRFDADAYLRLCCQMTATETEPKGITHARRHLSEAELEAYTVFSAKGLPEAEAFLQRCLDRSAVRTLRAGGPITSFG